MFMDAFVWLKTTFVKNIELALIIFFSALSTGYFLLTANPNWLSYFMVFSITLMLLGQVFLITSFGQAYFFYFYSFFLAISMSVLFWMALHVVLPDTNYSILLYVTIILILSVIPLIIHLKTRERIGTIPLIPVYSIFFLGLLLVLSVNGNVSNTISSTSLSYLFNLTIFLFIITSIFGLNIAYRTLRLNRILKIGNSKKYLIETKQKLKLKYQDENAQADIDLLTYYLSSSLESFIQGDFERSYMDAFKIIDNRGTSFTRVYTPSIDDSEWKKFNEIRKYLSHAKIEDKNKVISERLSDLKDVKKELFKETLALLEFVQFEFVMKALNKK
jgi:hypothetical protein